MSTIEFPEIAGRPFDAGDDVDDDVELEHQAVELDAGADVVEWTSERAAALVRGFGLVLHTLDPAAQLDGGAELWRATSSEASEIGEPLSRILARYAPARRLAGVVDEAELGAAFVSYAKRNLRERGQVIEAAREQEGSTGGGIFGVDDPV